MVYGLDNTSFMPGNGTESALEQRYNDLHIVIETYIKPIIYTIGIPGNLLSCIVWLQPRLRNSSACYFASLAFCEMAVLLLHTITSLQFVYHIPILTNQISCDVFNTLFIVTESLCVLIVLGLTVDRYIIVCHPMKRITLCSIKRAMLVILGLVILASLFGLAEGFFWTYDASSESCVLRVHLTSSNKFPLSTIGNIIILLSTIILPTVAICVLTVILLVFISRRNKQRLVLAPSQCRAQRESTMMILLVAIYVVISEIPESIIYLLSPFYPHGNQTIVGHDRDLDENWQTHYNFRTINILIETFSLTNYAINLLIYSLIGKQFRTTMLHCLFHGKRHNYNSSFYSAIQLQPICHHNDSASDVQVEGVNTIT